MGLVAYRDIGDDVRHREFELTTDIQDLYASLLELRAKGGGDWPESVNEALDIAVNKLAWSSGDDVHRIVFLVGDAPPHMDYAQDTKYPQTLKVAQQKDILVNAVLAGGARDTERVWREVAQLGGGRFIPIPQDGGEVVIIETPYDEEIIILQQKIGRTVLPLWPAADAAARRGQGAAGNLGRSRRAVVRLRHGELHQQARKGVRRSRHRRRRSRQRRQVGPQDAGAGRRERVAARGDLAQAAGCRAAGDASTCKCRNATP